MNPVRMALVAGLLAGGAGCSNLQQGMAFRPASERAPLPEAAPKAELGPIDPFHEEPETPVARISRYLPSMSRPAKADASAASPAVKKPGMLSGLRNRQLQAVPRPDPAAERETTTAARPRRSAKPSPRPTELEDQGIRTTATNDESRGDILAVMPLLGAAVIAESEPEVESPEPAAPPAKDVKEAKRPSRIAQAAAANTGTYGISIRRMPELEDSENRRKPASSVARRGSEAPAPARSVAREEDADAKRAGAEVAEAPAETDEPKAKVETKPEPVAVVERNLDPPKAEPGPTDEPSEPTRQEAASDRTDSDVTTTSSDAPPPIEPESKEEKATVERPRAPRPPARENTTGGDPSLAGRRRLERTMIARDSLPPDLPPVQFPRSYYENQPKKPTVASVKAPKRDTETRPARWSWTPQLFRRLRGESPSDNSTIRP